MIQVGGSVECVIRPLSSVFYAPRKHTGCRGINAAISIGARPDWSTSGNYRRCPMKIDIQINGDHQAAPSAGSR